MKVLLNNEKTKNKDLYFEEGFWTGKRKIVYDGITLTKIKRSIYEYENGDVKEQFVIKGNQLLGVNIQMFGEDVELTRKLTWYEIVLSVLVIAPCVLFGAIGGAIGGALGFTNATLIRKIDKLWLKILISIEFAVVGLLLSYLIAYMLLRSFNLIGLI